MQIMITTRRRRWFIWRWWKIFLAANKI